MKKYEELVSPKLDLTTKKKKLTEKKEFPMADAMHEAVKKNTL